MIIKLCHLLWVASTSYIMWVVLICEEMRISTIVCCDLEGDLILLRVKNPTRWALPVTRHLWWSVERAVRRGVIRQKLDPLIGVRCFSLDESDNQVVFFTEWLSQWLHLSDFSPLCISRGGPVNWPEIFQTGWKWSFISLSNATSKSILCWLLWGLNCWTLGCPKMPFPWCNFLVPIPSDWIATRV